MKLRKKTGAVIILDALGASNYTDLQIKEFLSTRQFLSDQIKAFAANSSNELRFQKSFQTPSIYTFGDTIVITFELRSKKHMRTHLNMIFMIIRRYIFHSMQNSVLYRGAMSVGHYFEDSPSNTVMGAAVSDAASWYEQADWAGVISTPQASIKIDFLFKKLMSSFCMKYDVPLKGGKTMNLHAVSWPNAFFDDELNESPTESKEKQYFLELIKELPIPRGTESKYRNMIQFFDYVAERRED